MMNAATDEEAAASAVGQAEQAVRSNQLDRAIDVLTPFMETEDLDVSRSTVARMQHLMGEALRRKKQPGDALPYYLASVKLAPTPYFWTYLGVMEAYAALQNDEEVAEWGGRLAQKKPKDISVLSRAIALCARFGQHELADRLFKLCESFESEFVGLALRKAAAEAARGNMEAARRYASVATALRPGDEKVALEASVVAYDPTCYFELRYRAKHGERADLPRAYLGDAAYAKRTEEERALLEAAFVRLGAHDLATAFEPGCGTGRLTGTLLEIADRVECVEISPTALEYWKQNRFEAKFPDKQIDAFCADIRGYVPSLRSASLILDGNLSPHLTDAGEAEDLFRVYGELLEPGGCLVLLGTIIGDRGSAQPAHISRRSVQDYTRLFDRNGIEVLWTETTSWRDVLIAGKKRGGTR